MDGIGNPVGPHGAVGVARLQVHRRGAVELLRVDNVVSEAARSEGRTLEGLGLVPRSIEAIVPSYLWRFRKTGQFHGRVA